MDEPQLGAVISFGTLKRIKNVFVASKRLCHLQARLQFGACFARMIFLRKLINLIEGTFDAISDALADICDLFTLTECRNFFSAAGYKAY